MNIRLIIVCMLLAGCATQAGSTSGDTSYVVFDESLGRTIYSSPICSDRVVCYIYNGRYSPFSCVQMTPQAMARYCS